ncbi:SDR family NAD(P)-dependent oxidoreductase [Marinobacterium sp. D7]|uniref:SDR family NAD(P)-dependent oxidoreductase n=1 Tax=Marinobacterium ramblicola TaxID=2849041 RepID=UPI001C2DD66E|nr:SDR family NAD(P)-dependent oxidoreductase [Marinobacterium ramblicola]MBV1788171.1 SDR family NAD(P)-dependent oxidoreductase [Marinobacterium ramblicola]
MKHRHNWQTAWVTGASQGIGRALATALCEKGVTVYASARRHEALEELADALKRLPGALIPCPLDVTDQAAIEGYFEQWENDNRLPDLIILNAGTHDPFTAREFSAQRVETLLNINLCGTLRSLDPSLKHCLKRGRGQIAIMASVAGYRGLPTAAAYGASKAALINLAEALRLDLAGSGVDLRLISPGFVRTPLTDKNQFTMPALIEPEQAAQWILKGLTSSRFEISFPARFTTVLKLLRCLPYAWYFPLVQKLTT